VVVAPVRRARFEGEYQSMRSAACASAPSHPLHVMPPRRTRNSHRPRASDRTMVDLEHPSGLPLSRTRWHRHPPRRKLMSMGHRPSFSREAELQWAGSRDRNLASGRGRTFFLTSLFIELIDTNYGRGGARLLWAPSGPAARCFKSSSPPPPAKIYRKSRIATPLAPWSSETTTLWVSCL